MVRLLRVVNLAALVVFVITTAAGLLDAISAPVAAWTLVGSGSAWAFSGLWAWQLKLKARAG
jgi:hypothetical protein